MRIVESDTSAEDVVLDTWSVEHLPHGAHVWAIYEEPTEQFTTTVPFIRGGLTRGDRCLYVYEGETLAEVKRALRAGGIDVVHEQRRGALAFFKPGEYVPRGLSPEAALDLLAHRSEEARMDGFGGLDVAAAKTWLPMSDVDLDWERQYEGLSTPRLRRLAAAVVCLLNRRCLPADLLVESCRLHAWVAFGEGLLPNPFYQPHDYGRRSPSSEAGADWQFRQLKRMHASVLTLRHQQQQFSVMVEQSPDSMASFGLDFRLRYVNATMQLSLGQSAGSLIGRTILEVGLPAQTARRWDVGLRQVVRSGQPASFIYPLQTQRGERFFQARLAPQFGTDHRVLGILAIGRDLTDLIQSQRDREHLYDAISVRVGDLQALVQRALGGAGREERHRQLAQLATDLQTREVAMLRMLAMGRSNREIGEALHLSPGTVKNYIVRLLDKLGVSNRAEAAARAAELGYLDDSPK